MLVITQGERYWSVDTICLPSTKMPRTLSRLVINESKIVYVHNSSSGIIQCVGNKLYGPIYEFLSPQIHLGGVDYVLNG